MIVICEQCGKRYRVDATRLKKDKVRTRCKDCGAIIEVRRAADEPVPADPVPAVPVFPAGRSAPAAAVLDERDMLAVSDSGASGKVGPMGSVKVRLIGLFLSFAVVSGAVLTGVYLRSVPPMMTEQINLRALSVCRSFSAGIVQPLLLRNYLAVNKAAAFNAQLPGTAYVSVVNQRGRVVAGIFGNVSRFDPQFVTRVKADGFPEEIHRFNPLPEEAPFAAKDLSVGGQPIHDVVVPIGTTGGVAHVGLFTEEVQRAARTSLQPLLFMLAAVAVSGALLFYLLARTIAVPIRALTEEAKRIGLGEIDAPIQRRGSGEIAELATALEMMRLSIKAAIYRLRQR